MQLIKLCIHHFLVLIRITGDAVHVNLLSASDKLRLPIGVARFE